MEFSPFSKKQRQVHNWWHPDSPVKDAAGIIADGSIRSGKTMNMALSYVNWADHGFSNQNFLLTGKSVGSIKRNIINTEWFKPALKAQGYTVKEKLGDKVLIVKRYLHENTFHYFGGKDEGSREYVQGITAAGFFGDEAALMPQSFVDQCRGRCSVEGSKEWYNCNPEGPSHWFKREMLDRAAELGLLHLHFRMEDNPSLSEKKRAEYYSRWHGVFFDRFILGLWVAAEGAIYSMFDALKNTYTPRLSEYYLETSTHYIAMDYGTQNATVFLHCVDHGDKIFIEDEYYHSGRDTEKYNGQKTDSDYADDLQRFMADKPRIAFVVVDPSAASFKAELRKRKIRTKDAINDVEDGIRLTASLLGRRIVQIAKSRCPNLVRELQSYVWDTKKTDQGKEVPLKKDDHAPDALRYFLMTVVAKRKFK